MNIFDIIGPVMIGPSSSHTAGIVKIGNIVKKIFAEQPTHIVVKFHGSLAKTYKGHGSDKAIIAGVLDFAPDDERIKNSLEIAKTLGIECEFKKVQLPFDAHPNTVIVKVSSQNAKLSVLGESVGGGSFVIKRIDDTTIEYNGQYDTLIINHNDAPGAIALVTSLLSVERVNIANMKVYRGRKGGTSIMIIEADGKLEKDLSDLIGKLPNINNAIYIPGLA